MEAISSGTLFQGVGRRELEVRAPWLSRGLAVSPLPWRLVLWEGADRLLEEPVSLHLKMCIAKAKITDNLFLENLGEVLIFRARRSEELVSLLQVASALDLHLETLCFLVRLLSE